MIALAGLLAGALHLGWKIRVSTHVTTRFFCTILALLLGMAVWEYASPGGNPRVGVLRFETTRGDRLFIGLLSAGSKDGFVPEIQRSVSRAKSDDGDLGHDVANKYRDIIQGTGVGGLAGMRAGWDRVQAN